MGWMGRGTALRSRRVRTERPVWREEATVLHPVGGSGPWLQEALYNLVLLAHQALGYTRKASLCKKPCAE